MDGRVSEALLSILLGIYLEMELPDPVVIVLHSEDAPECLPVAAPFYVLTVHKGSSVFTSLPTLVIFCVCVFFFSE